MDEGMVSSPDPLNDSATYQSPAKPRRSSRARRSLPLQGSSPKKQTFELDVGNSISPQKIRVTVEAGSSDAENAYPELNGPSASPTRVPRNRRRERTTTTTIPVKGLEDSEDEAPQAVTPKRGRGRPRKSIGTPVPTKKPGRASTPTQKHRRRSIGSLVDGDDDEDVNFQIGKGVEIGRGKGRSKSRSRSTKGVRNSTPASKDAAAAAKPASSAVSKKGRGRRKSLAPEEIEVLEDESCQGNTNDQEQDFGNYDNDGALEAIDVNTQNQPSPYSTIRSTTTVGGAETDIVIARFDPGNETPRKPGWSSPHVIEAPQPSSSRRRVNSYPSPSISPEKSTFGQYEEESVARVLVTESEGRRSPESAHDGYDDDHYNEEDGDVVEQYRDFDTILESEGFSMISVDSVPSLREHFSSPANQPEKQQPTQARNKSLLTVREDAAYDDSFSAIPEEVLEAATPARKPQNPRLLSVQSARVDDSFSSIPPEILQAATPARKSQVSKLISQNTPVNDSFSSVAPEILEAATPHSKAPNKRLSAANLGVNDQYEDSFSAIPTDVLDAATPAAARHGARPPSEGQSVLVPRASIPPSHGQEATAAPPRLLTPDETPSPPAEGSDGQRPSSNGNTSAQDSRQDISIAHSHLPSSPPSIAPRRYTYTAHLRQNRQFNPNMTQTPSIVFSSPTLPPPIQINRGIPVLAPPSEQAERPALSPIVRAGRMLQDILVPSSPRSRSQSLGSPFKSPAADRRSSSIIVQDSYPSPVYERLAGPLPRSDLSGRFDEGSSSQRQSRPSQQDDPFRNSATSQQRSPSPEEKQQYTLELPQSRHHSDPRLRISRPEPETIRSDDAMSWQAEEEVPLPGSSISLRNNIDLSNNSRSSAAVETSLEDRWAAERAAVVQQAANANSSKVIVVDSDDEQSKDGQDEDEDFGLLLETLNSSSPVVERRDDPKEVLERPRRSKIPSPWRKNSKRLVYSDELSRMSSSPPESKAPVAKLFGNSFASEPVTVRRIVPQEPGDDTDLDLSQHQIPQKANFNPRPRESGNLDLSALLGSSPPKGFPAVSTRSHKPSFQRQPQSSEDSSRELPKEQPKMTPDERIATEQVSAEFLPIPQKTGFNPRPRAFPGEDPKKEMPKTNEARPREQNSGDFNPIPQKMGFNPRRRVSSAVKPSTDVPALFAGSARPNQTTSSDDSVLSSPVPTPLAASLPNRANTFQGNRDSSNEVSPDCSINSNSSNPDKENQAINKSRTLKWTESLSLDTTTNVVLQTPLPPLTSPTKSCLRSPLKTPSAGPSFGSATANLSPSKGVTWVSSSPTPESPMEEPLSASTWSKDHWRLLDTIVQSWKPENNVSPFSSDDKESSALRRRNSTRVISRLLGKNVFSGDQKMKLEQWHLEAVDEFRGCVPGWQEKVIAMRLFALLVGEERRAKGLVGGGRAGNYDHLN
ncbi:hypothetical protein ONS95_005668 [Cadophora gregata]|uniref:uncharacterized protein n=1 Tax=Cadophora gregata TaxID=51156 RepID=UPI0026DB637A|nr:uncharacterized protein ONS95_005668 [Cadophora gregata]KAK0103655.1 hypothetical protein ONS95_005668 [Cadophora gregata]KAK0107850.1 hypothetical protein ONS96_003640 [Cadophora gregata f. sp. sojae]